MTKIISIFQTNSQILILCLGERWHIWFSEVVVE
jgi:hypothetical protein